MHASKFLQILMLSAALSGYSAWALSMRDTTPAPIETSSNGLPPLLRLPKVEALWHDSGTLFVDVRSPFDYEFGHIAGAVNLPGPEFEQVYPTLKPRLERARTIVVYCKSPDCGQSLWTAIRLRHEGLTQTMIYPEGWNEWFNHKLPIVRIREQ
jgi:rhodanese-related sulfurtransferase